jgi:hypothetical protein
MEITDTSLFRFLERGDRLYFGKLIELKARVSEWLSYIPQTFPQYQRIRHRST